MLVVFLRGCVHSLPATVNIHIKHHHEEICDLSDSYHGMAVSTRWPELHKSSGRFTHNSHLETCRTHKKPKHLV